ncbi:MAG: hypothetical protein ACOCXT_01360 [Candidatus Dojkabacteria bacterium]
MDDVEELCQRTIVINKGEKIFDGSTSDLKGYFGDYRVLEFIMPNCVKPEEVVTRIPYEVVEVTKNAFSIQVERKESAKAIAVVMQENEVDEINIKETELSEVIGKIYKGI